MFYCSAALRGQTISFQDSGSSVADDWSTGVSVHDERQEYLHQQRMSTKKISIETINSCGESEFDFSISLKHDKQYKKADKGKAEPGCNNGNNNWKATTDMAHLTTWQRDCGAAQIPGSYWENWEQVSRYVGNQVTGKVGTENGDGKGR